MCGIFGFSSCITKEPQKMLSSMADILRHRGPDGEGFFIDEKVSLGMVRLSIIDIENGNQPFFNENKNIVVFCNGEIYNYIELKKELSSKGYRFKTESDIEVIPALYEEYGISFVEKLNGMFAITLYDLQKKELFLIRDRLGIKPLYYYEQDGKIIFSSEIKSILSCNDVRYEPDFKSLSTSLDILFISGEDSPIKNIKKLPAGCILKFSSNGRMIWRYWDIRLKLDEKKGFEDSIEELEILFKDSCYLRKRSDVNMGVFLSGGIDSSAVAAFLSNQIKGPIDGYHISWAGMKGKIDEKKYAEEIAEKYNISLQSYPADGLDYLKRLPRLMWHLEEPLADGAFVFTNLISSIAKDDVKVIFSGAGGDELFGGYFHHKNHSLLKSLLGAMLYNKAPFFSYYDMHRGYDSKMWSEIFPWYTPSSRREKIDSVWKEGKDIDEINAIMLADVKNYLCDDILLLTDKMTMAESLECRVPILDHRIVELAFSIESGFKTKNKEKKIIFKKMLEKYVSDDVLYRKKEGFGAPFEDWILKMRKAGSDDFLLRGVMAGNALINKAFLCSFCRKTRYNKIDSMVYWKILTMELWFRMYIFDEKYHSIRMFEHE